VGLSFVEVRSLAEKAAGNWRERVGRRASYGFKMGTMVDVERHRDISFLTRDLSLR
jgi:hypothetical protein